MKKPINLIISSIALVGVTSLFTACGDGGTFTDSRDGQTYKTVKIGDQIWMAENLKYKSAGYTCPNDDPENCSSWGNLYNIDELAEDPCPNGWHIPTTLEFVELLNYIKKNHPDIGVGVALKSKSGWDDNIEKAEEKYGKRKGNGDDVVAFNAKPTPNKGDVAFITWPSFYEIDTLIGVRWRKLKKKHKQYSNSVILDRNINYAMDGQKGAIRCIENSAYLATKLIPSFLSSFTNEYRFYLHKEITPGFIVADHDFNVLEYLAYPDSILKFKVEFKGYYGDSVWEKRIPKDVELLDSVVFSIKNMKPLEYCAQNNEWKITEKASAGDFIIQYNEPNDEKCKFIVPEEVRMFLNSIKTYKNMVENGSSIEKLFERASREILTKSVLKNKY